jgi:hypothetical protein
LPKEHQAHAEPPPHSTSHLAARAAHHLAAAGALRAPGGREQPTTLVLGGGIAGIAAAVGLAERGVRVTLVEQHPTVLLPALLWCMAMHAHSAAPDITADREAGVATVATLIGRQRTLVLCGLAYGLAAALVYPSLGSFAVVAGGVPRHDRLVAAESRTGAALRGLPTLPRRQHRGGRGDVLRRRHPTGHLAVQLILAADQNSIRTVS